MLANLAAGAKTLRKQFEDTESNVLTAYKQYADVVQVSVRTMGNNLNILGKLGKDVGNADAFFVCENLPLGGRF